MELEQLHEAGSSQAEQRTAAEKGVRDATVKVKRLEEVVSEKRSLFKEADGEEGSYREFLDTKHTRDTSFSCRPLCASQ